MKNKLIFLDLDGTLLSDDKQISQENIIALQKAQSMGHRLAFTSGRPMHGGKVFLDHMPLDYSGCFYIGYQGAVIFDLEKHCYIKKNPMPRPELEDLLHFLHQRGHYLQCFDTERLYCLSYTEQTRRYCETTQEPVEVVQHIREMAEHEIYKVMVIDFENRASLLSLERECKRRGLGWQSFFSSPWFYEFCAKEVNKGAALRSLSEYLDWDLADTVAIGDEENDISMIRQAGVGIAMKNARSEIRQWADVVTARDHNHSGVAWAIENFIL